MSDERIITNAMIREQDQERITELEGLLRQVRDCGAMANWIGVSNTLREQINAALKEGA